MARKAVVCVGIASYPNAGAGIPWFYLQWVLGFREFGWDVLMIENLRGERCVDKNWRPTPFAERANPRLWETVLDRFNLTDYATLLVDGHSLNFHEAQRFA